MIVKCSLCESCYDSEVYPRFHKNNPYGLCMDCFRLAITSGMGTSIGPNEIFMCERCSVVSSPNERVYNYSGEAVCMYCTPQEDIAYLCDWQEAHKREHAQIDNRWEILDL